MGKVTFLTAACLLCLAAPAAALTTDEVIKLKQAGVSDATIEKMIEQEKKGQPTKTGPITETDDMVIYRSGPSAQELRRQEQHERWKEEKSMDAMKNVIIDNRPGRPGVSGGQGGQ